MKTTVSVDKDLLDTAKRVTSIRHKNTLVREALRAYIQRENARHLIALGGTMPNIKPVPRRRPASE
jgi:metal-responsive CopG/Arc/MetJ family transcriptional regulator